jgi:carboxyl-terminal processing protease
MWMSMTVSTMSLMMGLVAAESLAAPPYGSIAPDAAPQPGAVQAGAMQPHDAYTTGVHLVERLFLEPERVDEVSMLRSAARGAVHDLHWLQMRATGRSLELFHGAGTPIGRIEVRSMDDLPSALARLESLIVASGYDLGDVDVQLSLLAGMADALDRYSRVLADERLERFNERLTGTRVGIGATLEWRDRDLVVAQVSPGGPAHLGGVRLGDAVLRIDGRSTVSMPTGEASRRARGEDGTQVVLTVRRTGPDGSAEERDLALTRAEVVVPNVTNRVLPGRVGYVHIDHVSQRTVENLRAALDELRRHGALEHGLVIDLRGNTGGSMKESAHVADVFLEHGLLLRTVGKDGGRVQNLQAEMYARPDDDEPPIPIVVVVDDRTASGSEILAGALLELERAALVGTRTYGKGTVQKIYNLQSDIRLKLTVARYILANDRSISDGGLIPDVVVGRITFEDGPEGNGADDVRFNGWDERWQQVPWSRILPEVRTGEGDVDLPVELGRRAILQTRGTARRDIVASLEREAAVVRVEQEERLRDALVAKGVDWSPADEDGGRISAQVGVQAARASGDTWVLEARVTSNDPAPLHQVLVEIACRSAAFWDGVVVPIGQITPGGTGTGRVKVALPAGVDPRQDLVEVRLRADRRPPLNVGEEILDGGSTASPTLRVQARLAPVADEVGPHGFPVHQAEIVVQNLSRTSLTGVEVRFGFPGSDAVELLDHGARAAEVGGRSEQRMTLQLELGPEAPQALPLALLVDADRFGRLIEWPLSLPTTGATVPLQAPTIEARPAARSAPVGAFTLPIVVSDDRRVDHVVVWVNGEKVAWGSGGAARIELSPTFPLASGDNRIVVQTEDDQRIQAFRTVTVRGEAEPEAVDAGM